MSPEPLTPDQDAAWRAFLHTSTRLLSLLDQEMKDTHGERLSYFDVLSNLSESQGGELRMSELADQTLFSRTRLSYTVTQLEKRGLVKRKPDPSDKRGVVATLTPKGRAHHQQLARTHLEGIHRHFLNHTTHQSLVQLIESLTPILTQLEPPDTDHEQGIHTRT